MATLTASGAFDGGVMVPAPIVGYDSTGDSSTFTMPMQNSGAFLADINMGFPGRPMAMAYAADAGLGCDVTITSGTSSADTWTAILNSSTQPNKGSCSLTLTGTPTLGSQGYVVHGTLAISAVAQGGASAGTVNISGSF